MKPLANPGVASALLAFAAMLKLDYDVPKDIALKGLALAYDLNEGKKQSPDILRESSEAPPP